MAKLVKLVETIASHSGLALPSVNLVARHLREAGLITTGGRGPGGAEMQASDATNLLIGVVASMQVKDAPAVVRLFRNAKPFAASWSDDHELADLSIRNFAILPFGGMLDELFRRLIEDGDILDTMTGKPVDLQLEFNRTGQDYSGTPTLVINRDREGVAVENQYGYHSNNSTFDDLPGEDHAAYAKSLFNKGGIGLKIDITVKDYLIFPIACCLAGRPFDAE